MSAEKPGKSDKKDNKNPKLRKMMLRKKIDKMNQKQKSDQKSTPSKTKPSPMKKSMSVGDNLGKFDAIDDKFQTDENCNPNISRFDMNANGRESFGLNNNENFGT